MNTYEFMAKNLLLLAHNPAAMQQLQLDQLRSVQEDGGIELREPTDPVVYMAEMGVMWGHTTIQGMRELIPKIYPIQAQSYDDLFRHMSDVDYIDVFAQPTRGELILYLDLDSVLAKAVPLSPGIVRKIVIPRDTVFTVSGYTFAIQYPIEIRVLPYGTNDNPAIQVVWVTENQSPISPVATNALEWAIGSVPGTASPILGINIPALQYAVKSESDTITGTNQYTMIRSFTNKFFYVRVWMKRNDNSAWEEISHTHSRDVYSKEKATALIQVEGQNIRCIIPAVYMKTGLVSGEIRMDIYTTIGPLSVDLSSYAADSFTFTLRDLNGEYDATYYNPLKTFSIKQMAAKNGSFTTGGRGALTFEELRTRVVDNAVGTRRLPITEKQLSNAVSDYGLTLTKPIAYVTGRTYHLSAAMPESSIKNVSSAIGTAVAPVYFTIADLAALNTVKDNGNRMTIQPGTIYGWDGQNLEINASMTQLSGSMAKEDLVSLSNENRYMFNPFHYVVDINNKSIDVRIYQLDKPEVTAKRFIDTNVTTELSVVTDSYEFVMTSKGYVLRIVTKSEQPYQELDDDQVFVQLSYMPRGYEDQVTWINGELVGKRDKERVYEFLLETNLDVDRNDELVLTNTRMSSAFATPIPIPLTVDCNIIYGCTNYYPEYYTRAEMDNVLVAPSRDGIGITHEIMALKLGTNLAAFWRKSRPVTDTINYRYYQTDVAAVHKEDKVKLDANGAPMYTVDQTKNPPISIVYDYRKGDTVIDEKTGKPVIEHYVGDQMYDALGEPLIENPRGIKYRLEMVVLDARYRFATDTTVKSYLDNTIAYMVKLVSNTIPTLQTDLLELTEAYFVPLTTMGYVDARLEDGTISPLPAENQFTVKYYLTPANRKDSDLQKVIKSKTSSVINNWLNTQKTVSATEIGKALKTELSESIIAAELGNLGPDKDMRIFTVVNEEDKAILGKKLEIQANGELGLRDDIIISFAAHDTTPTV